MDGFKNALERPRAFDDALGEKHLNHITEGQLETSAGKILTLKTTYGVREWLWRIAVRFGFARNSYRIPPGLYAIGQPDTRSPIMVTCNYKLTVDLLRSNLRSRNIWILVLNTDGINVWCAAGKGTFCTAEVLYWLEKTQLKNFVENRELIMPQLGAPSIEPHLIRRYSGYKVVYGPIRGRDISKFLDSAGSISEVERLIKFDTADRFEVAVLELFRHLCVSVFLIVIGSIWPQITVLRDLGWAFTAATIAGSLLLPLLLPVMPLRGFVQNGLLTYVPLAFLFAFAGVPIWSLTIAASYAAWQALNFTGSTTFTSYTAVKTEIESTRFLVYGPIFIGIMAFIMTQFKV